MFHPKQVSHSCPHKRYYRNKLFFGLLALFENGNVSGIDSYVVSRQKRSWNTTLVSTDASISALNAPPFFSLSFYFPINDFPSRMGKVATVEWSPEGLAQEQEKCSKPLPLTFQESYFKDTLSFQLWSYKKIAIMLVSGNHFERTTL